MERAKVGAKDKGRGRGKRSGKRAKVSGLFGENHNYSWGKYEVV
jgi:hypothetical protein